MTSELFKIAEDSARGGFFLIIGSISATVISAIATILIARILGPELYGQYTLALVVPTILFLFADLGINQGLIKFAASLQAEQDTGRIPQLIKYGMVFKAGIGTVIYLISFAFADHFATILLNRPEMGPYLRIASITIIFQTIFTTATSAFVGLDKTEYNALTTNIQAIAKTIISVALVLFGFSVAGAIIGNIAGYSIAGIIGALMLFLFLRQHTKGESSSNFTSDITTLISYGLPLYMSALLAGFTLPYQNLILSMFTSDVAIGNFKAATNFITLITVFSIPIGTALLPAFSKLNSSTSSTTTEFFKLANKYTTLLVVPVAVLIMTFSYEIVQIVYGPTFQSAPLFLSLYAPLYFLVGMGYLILPSLFNGRGETQSTFKTHLITIAVFIVLAPLAAQTHSVPGLIIAFIIANALGTLYGLHIARKKFRIEFATKSLGKIYAISIISSILPLLLLQFAPTPRLVNVIAGGILYLVIYANLIPLTRTITESELENTTDVLQRIQLLNLIAKPVIDYQKRILSRTKPKTRNLK